MVKGAERAAAVVELDRLRAEIVAGRLAVPATLEELAKFAAVRQ
jgi:hypothetical protein